jgi:hypothetical protein
MRLLFVISLIATCWIGGSAAAEDGVDPRRVQAQSLVSSGKPAEALPIYDELTAAGSSDPALYSEASRAAAAAHDMRRVAVYLERNINTHPYNYILRHILPFAWRIAGDEAQAQRSREAYIGYWKASTDPTLRSSRSFRIDRFSAGNATVEVYQCVEIAGPLGVGYAFEIFAPANPPADPNALAQAQRQRIVLEHDRNVQEFLAKQLNKPDVVRPSLDLLSPGTHTTLRWFDAEPDYPTIRDIVAQYVASETDLPSKPPMGNAWAGLTCLTEGK